MTEAVEQLITRIEGLSSQERAELAYFLIRALDDEDQGDVSDAWDAELNRRLDEIRSGKAKGKPADQFFAELRSELP